MKLRDVQPGRTYAAKVSGRLVPVTIVRERQWGASDRHPGWVGRNEATGREVHVRSAQRLRFEVEPYTKDGRRRWRRKEV